MKKYLPTNDGGIPRLAVIVDARSPRSRFRVDVDISSLVEMLPKNGVFKGCSGGLSDKRYRAFERELERVVDSLVTVYKKRRIPFPYMAGGPPKGETKTEMYALAARTYIHSLLEKHDPLMSGEEGE